jgi:repressor LexA
LRWRCAEIRCATNKEMQPIYAPAANVSIQGKVLGVLRKYA